MNKSILHLIIATMLIMGICMFLSGCGCGDDDDDDNDAGDDDTASPDDDDADDDTADDDVDDDVNDDADDDCEEAPASTNENTLLGLQYLGSGIGGPARLEFLTALDADSEDQDALYGLILSDTLMNFDTIGLIAEYISMLMGNFIEPDETARADDIPDSGQGFIDDVLEIALQGLVLQYTDELIERVPQALETPCLSLELENMPMYLNFDLVAEPGGDDWDYGEVQAGAAVGWALGGVIRILTALNLDFDLSVIAFFMDFDWDSYEILDILAIVVDVLQNTMNDEAYPDFLTYGEEGLAKMQQAQIDMGLGFMYAADVYDHIRAETDDQADDILAFADLNANSQWDEAEPFVIPPWGQLDDEQMAYALAFEEIFIAVSASILDNTEYDDDPDNDAPLNLNDFNSLLSAMGIWPILPGVEMPLNEFFESAEIDGPREALISLLNILDLVLPDPPAY